MSFDGLLQRANVDGTSLETLATGLNSPRKVALHIPQCSSTVTMIEGLREEVNTLNTSTTTINSLQSSLDSVQTSLDFGNRTSARTRMKNFIGTVVYRSNLSETFSTRIILGEANHLICSAANVIIGIPLP